MNHHIKKIDWVFPFKCPSQKKGNKPNAAYLNQ